MATNFQKYLDDLSTRRSSEWETKLKSLDMTGPYEMADAEAFLKSVTMKNTASWAVRLELTTRHSALKKIIDGI
jgi:hypothetical protein